MAWIGLVIMNTLEAHEHFASICDRQSHNFDIAEATIDGVDVWPAVQTACAELSGQLDTCRTLEDLTAAAGHCMSLLNIGIVTGEAIEAKTLEIVTELVEWGDRFYDASRN